MKYLVPLACATPADGMRFADAIAPHRLSARQVGRLYHHYVDSAPETRALVLTDPVLVLRMTEEAGPVRVRPEASAPDALLTDFQVLGAVARRAERRLHHGGGSVQAERTRAWHLFEHVQWDFAQLHWRCIQELRNARSEPPNGDLALTGKGHGIPQIARALRISRGTVRRVLQAGTATVPPLDRPEKAAPYRDQIVALLTDCKGNLVRVHDLLSRADRVLPAAWDRACAAAPWATTTSRSESKCSMTPRRVASRPAMALGGGAHVGLAESVSPPTLRAPVFITTMGASA